VAINKRDINVSLTVALLITHPVGMVKTEAAIQNIQEIFHVHMADCKYLSKDGGSRIQGMQFENCVGHNYML
jgi:hypothetical protein